MYSIRQFPLGMQHTFGQKYIDEKEDEARMMKRRKIR
jgi:hypothetical protein